MSSTITALFDTRAEAEAAKERLRAASFDVDHVHVHDKSSTGYNEQRYSTHRERGFWDSVKHAFLPDEDRHTYEEGVRRGGALLTADVADDKVDDAVRILEHESNSIDIDDRSNQWRQSGWDYAGGSTGAQAGTGERAALFGGTGETDRSDDRDRSYETDRTRDTDRTDREEVIPVVEEQLIVGKREVGRGSARVRSYVTETPVSEQIRLREERINIDRRPVDQPLDAADDAFRERSIDLTATGEEAVVGKTARVVEEVVVSKTADERTETVSDTVRRTDVDIDDDSRTGGTSGTRADYDDDVETRRTGLGNELRHGGADDDLDTRRSGLGGTDTDRRF